MAAYDPKPDAIDFLSRKSPVERHAIARLLDVDGDALAVLRWIAEQPDCDGTTAAMIFWRLWSLPAIDAAAREAALQAIVARDHAAATIAWDGLETWQRTRLIGAPRADGLKSADLAVPARFHGPFGTTVPEPAKYVFFDHDYADDDIFDSLWRTAPIYAQATDWLAGKPAETWMAALDELVGGHPDSIHEWMLAQPECSAPVAGQIFWMHEPGFFARERLQGRQAALPRALDLALARWRKGDLAPSDLDFSRYAGTDGYRKLLASFPGRTDPLGIPQDLLVPRNGRVPARSALRAEFDFWFIAVDIGGQAPRPRVAATAAWQRDLAAAKPSVLDRLFYGEVFSAERRQIDRAWKRFNLLTALLAIVLVVLIRTHAPAWAGFTAFLLLLGVISLFHASAVMGGWRRLVPWWIATALVTLALAFLFRRLDG